MSSLDLDKLGSALAGERSDRGVGSGESSAALEVELRAAKNTIKNYHACLMLLLLVLIIAVDDLLREFGKGIGDKARARYVAPAQD